MIQRLLSAFVGLLLLAVGLNGQVVTSDPAFFTDQDEIVITFDATQGTAGLEDCNCDVYLHTGVITENSTAPSDWKYVVTTWGEANPDWKLTPVPGEDNKYTYTIGPSIREYYGVPADEMIEKINFVFRNADGSKEGKDVGGADIFIDLQEAGAEISAALASPTANQIDLALGQTIFISGNASASARLSIVDNGTELIFVEDATELTYTLTALEAGTHEVLFIADTGSAADTSSFTYTAELRMDVNEPALEVVQINPGTNLDIAATTYVNADFTLSVNGATEAQINNTALISEMVAFNAEGIFELLISAEYNGQTIQRGFLVIVGDQPPVQVPPAGIRDGITYLSDSSVRLQLNAPGKDHVVVIGSFNDWVPQGEYLMNRSTNGGRFFIDITGLTPGENYTFQYLVDGEIRTADPLSEVVLDRFNDPFISEEVYPDLPPYPEGETEGIVTLLQPGASAYVWQNNDFEPAPKEELVIYELLIRDFLESHDYTTLIDTLDYLADLNINAIELMPVNEFENNNSWGYNPSFHMALDKYYGPKDELKRFMDECHARGIAVILDVVYNHAFSQSPLAQLYWDPVNFRPAANNPWLNVEARHPFNVGFDFNHQSADTRAYVDRVIEYWLSEFRVDGYRFDLSKGFTQNFSNDLGAWNAYDASRVAILKHYADEVWSANPNAYVILEHFADNAEELELHTYGNGILFWAGAGIHNEYLEASMGYGSNLNGASYLSRNWTEPHLIVYMESHDEERMMFKNESFGNSSGAYDVKETITALRRVELASTFFYTIPGPKMLWQFGELGYEHSINYCPGGNIDPACRVDPKPIRWDYLESQNRQRLYNVVSALIGLKTEYEVFNTENFAVFTIGSEKRIHLFGDDMDVAVIGNFDVIPGDIDNAFPQSGWWYEYFSGDSILVEDPAFALPLSPGEYRLYTTVRLDEPPGGFITDTHDPVFADFGLWLSPNPSAGEFQIQYELSEAGMVQIDLFDLAGRHLRQLSNGQQSAGLVTQAIDLKLPAGMYLLRLQVNGQIQMAKVVVE